VPPPKVDDGRIQRPCLSSQRERENVFFFSVIFRACQSLCASSEHHHPHNTFFEGTYREGDVACALDIICGDPSSSSFFFLLENVILFSFQSQTRYSGEEKGLSLVCLSLYSPFGKIEAAATENTNKTMKTIESTC
jgi:hypothetical protein